MSEELARQFHEAYERLAPQFSYTTREASAKPWDEVPHNNQLLMIAVTDEIENARIKQLDADLTALKAQLDEANEKLRWHLISESLPDTGLLLVADSEDWSSIEYRWFDDELGLPAWINCWMYAENLVPEGGIVTPTSEA
jgi:hypothetical protein